jgi:hypothetical protein
MEKGEMAATEIRVAVAKKDRCAGIVTSCCYRAIQGPPIFWNQFIATVKLRLGIHFATPGKYTQN